MATTAECTVAEQARLVGLPCTIGFLLVVAEAAVARVVGPRARVGLSSPGAGIGELVAPDQRSGGMVGEKVCAVMLLADFADVAAMAFTVRLEATRKGAW